MFALDIYILHCESTNTSVDVYKKKQIKWLLFCLKPEHKV